MYDVWDFEDELDIWAREVSQGGQIVLPQSKGIINPFTLGLYKHIRTEYLGFDMWIRRRCPLCRDHFFKLCFKCKEVKSIKFFSRRRYSISEIASSCTACYDKTRSRDAMRAGANKRRATPLSLPSIWGMAEGSNMRTEFTPLHLEGDEEYADDHFIPLSTGHCGTYLGNMSPLSRTLNSSKSDANPFEWFEANRQRFDLEQSAFDAPVVKLAQQNGLTSEELRDFTYWCFANQRSIDEVRADNERYGYKRPSLEIWREVVALPFPIRVDFGDLSLDHAAAA